jgi:hypothetical protein
MLRNAKIAIDCSAMSIYPGMGKLKTFLLTTWTAAVNIKTNIASAENPFRKFSSFSSILSEVVIINFLPYKKRRMIKSSF